MNTTPPRLAPVDWIIILAFIMLSIVIGVVLSRRGRSSVREYFTSGGATSWWLLGTSMVATTFAADTPLTLSGWVVTKGIAQNWFWWCQVPVTMLGVFFIARLWRRANLITDNELVSLRYSGPSAAVLRGFKGLFYSLIYGTIIMGWVNLAMTKIIQLSFPSIPLVPVVDRAMLWTYLHTSLSEDLDPTARKAMRAGQVDPLGLYYTGWRLHDCPTRTTVLAEVELILRRLEVLEQRVKEPAPPAAEPQRGGSAAAPAPADPAADLQAYAATVDAAALLERVGLAGSRGDLAGQWTHLDPGGESARPPELRLLHAVDQAALGVNKLKIILVLFLIVVAYTVISGLWGVLITDFIQFWIAMFGCIALAVLATRHLGGVDAMLIRMGEIYGPDRARGMVSMIPAQDAGGLDLMPWTHFLVFVFFSWYVVQFTDGGSYLAQRMLAAKDERHAALGYLWFGVANYCVRMWPWIVVGFAAAVMFPYVRDPITGQYPGDAVAEEGYVRVMLAVLPAGLLGLMLAAFLAAYMSTISAQLNLGASYLLNDFYRPFVRPGASERHYVFVSQLATIVLAGLGLIVSLFYTSIGDAWFFLGTLSAGIGVIYLLRWFWWRINAWSEIVCLLTLLLCAVAIKAWPRLIESPVLSYPLSLLYDAWPAFIELRVLPYPLNLLYLVPISVGAALLATWLTAPVDEAHLRAFFRKVQPGGPGWRHIEAAVRRDDPQFRCRTTLTWTSARRWILSTAAIFCVLVGSGKLVVGDVLTPGGLLPGRVLGALLVGVGVVLGVIVARGFGARRWADAD